jgi:hypothetical protein
MTTRGVCGELRRRGVKMGMHETVIDRNWEQDVANRQAVMETRIRSIWVRLGVPAHRRLNRSERRTGRVGAADAITRFLQNVLYVQRILSTARISLHILSPKAGRSTF